LVCFDRAKKMSVNYGSKRVVTGAHYGMRDWLSQRITATLMAIYTVLLLAQVLFAKGPMGYDAWAGIFATQWMKTLTLVVFVSLGWHAWVGVRDIWMDYVKPAAVRLVLQVATICWLVGCIGWAVQVLWRI
jgi:succinate dehydrogenase / fumarate reductase, membrane anchor subunit